jgi:DNA-binding YbaB/EbfC family protein
MEPLKQGGLFQMSRFDQAKALLQMRKIQKELAKMVVAAEAGDGAVRIEISGEQKIKRVVLDPDKIDLERVHVLERWLEDAFREAVNKSQQEAAQRMQPFMGMLGNLGL